jgi:anti-sigma factor RsiW
MTCQQVVEIVTDYLDGKLSPQHVQWLEYHLQHCDACTRYIEQVRTTTRIAAAARLDEHPDRDALLATFRAFKGKTET